MNHIEEMISDLVSRARAAQQAVSNYTQKEIDLVCLAAAWEVYRDDRISMLAEAAVRETSMGNVKDKITKHKNKILGVVKDITGALSVGCIERDEMKGISKYAKPVGVVGALTPVTNPTATPGSNAVSVLKGRNAVIFAPHPKSKDSSSLAVSFMREGLKRIGAPEDLVQIIAEPSIPATEELMKQVDLVLATGGAAMVKAAYSSGTPAYGVGPGNSVQMVAEDADVHDAAAKITLSKCFDYATSCSSENSVIVEKSVYDSFVRQCIEEGGYLCSPREKELLEQWMWKSGRDGGARVLNPAIVAQSAQVIARDAGLDVPPHIRMLMVEGSEPAAEDRFAYEKLSPVLTLWKYADFSHGVRLLEEITNACGRGHSCGIHTFNHAYIEHLAERMLTSRIMVRQAQAPANGGSFTNGMPSTVTLGCGTWGGNITTENISYRHFLNITWVSEPISGERPTDEEMFAPLWKQAGKG